VRLPSIVSAAGFALVAAAVQLGAFKDIDQWAIDHLMPWVSPAAHPSTFASTVLPFTSATPGLEIPAKLWLYPASVPISGLVTAGCCVYLWRRGGRLPAAAWASAWLLGNAIEVVGKETISRATPHMTWEGYVVPLPTFGDSFPSGHTLRAVLLASLVTVLWRRLGVPAAVWVAGVLPLLVVTNAHAPSDVIGGAFLGAALALVCARTSPVASSVQGAGTVERQSRAEAGTR
jgi:membrane-associated phospholipid phosphatase